MSIAEENDVAESPLASLVERFPVLQSLDGLELESFDEAIESVQSDISKLEGWLSALKAFKNSLYLFKNGVALKAPSTKGRPRKAAGGSALDKLVEFLDGSEGATNAEIADGTGIGTAYCSSLLSANKERFINIDRGLWRLRRQGE